MTNILNKTKSDRQFNAIMDEVRNNPNVDKSGMIAYLIGAYEARGGKLDNVCKHFKVQYKRSK